MKITRLLTLALGAFAFAACSQDDSVTENMRKTNITLHAPVFDADWSRSQGFAPGKGFRIKHELDEQTGINFSWTQGDNAGVFAEEGGQLELKMIEGQDAAATVYFDRKGYELAEGTNYVAYYPLVDKVTQKPYIEVSYRNQVQEGNRSYDHLAQYDYMVSNPVKVVQQNTADFEFKHQGAILRLLIDMPEADTYDSIQIAAYKENGTDTAKIFTTDAVLNLFDETEVIHSAYTSNVMTLKFNNTKTTESDKLLEAWLMISPVDFTTNKLTITVYSATGKTPVSYTLCPGKKFEKGKAYQIKLPGDAVDHDKNPLLKWAEYNLQYNKTTGKSEFATSYTAGGSLYQWGRNYGWTDYKDAMGAYDYSTKTWDYYVGNYNVYVHSGTGKYYVSNGDIECPSVYGYSSQADIKDMTNKWLMNSNSTSSNNGDYWFWTGGGNNWSERAKLVGYDTDTPCPEGWRLPTVADFKEIMPSKSISTSNSLATALNNLVELKEIEGVCKYAIKWSKNNNGIVIQAIVVPSTFTQSDLASVDWNNGKVVTRHFPFSGAIRSTVASCSPQYPQYYDFILDVVAVPLPLGDIVFTGNNEYYDYWNRIWWATWNVQTDYSDHYGAYWASDSKQTFTFVDNSGWYGQTTQFNMTTQKAHNAYAVRCVKAE